MIELKFEYMAKAKIEWIETVSRFVYNLWCGGLTFEEISTITDMGEIEVQDLCCHYKEKLTQH